MCTQYVSMVNLECHIGYSGFIGKTCENNEAGKWKECKGDGNKSALCILHFCKSLNTVFVLDLFVPELCVLS